MYSNFTSDVSDNHFKNINIDIKIKDVKMYVKYFRSY